MPHYKLRSSGRHDVKVDEIVLSRDENGEVEHSLSAHRARSIPEELKDKAAEIAGRLGFRIEEAPEPDEEEEARQEVGADVAGSAPVVRDTSQQQPAPTASQTTGPAAGDTGVDQADSTTTDYGSGATSETTSTTPPPTNT